MDTLNKALQEASEGLLSNVPLNDKMKLLRVAENATKQYRWDSLKSSGEIFRALDSKGTRIHESTVYQMVRAAGYEPAAIESLSHLLIGK